MKYSTKRDVVFLSYAVFSRVCLSYQLIDTSRKNESWADFTRCAALV